MNFVQINIFYRIMSRIKKKLFYFFNDETPFHSFVFFALQFISGYFIGNCSAILRQVEYAHNLTA